jgi:hypothetical protein
VDKIEVDRAIWDGMRYYLRALHEQKAVDDMAMKSIDYMSLEKILELWGISAASRQT